MSQTKPHFIFNALTVIRSIYQDDPEVGDQAITDFARFLRYSLDAITKGRMIDFIEELEHVKTYVELQKLRFGDSLQVTYDLECLKFKVPTLSLQTIAENAVRHGARNTNEDVGKVLISSREFDDHYEISVIDNGPGFDPNDIPDDIDRPHIGIANVKDRLELLQCGELKIDSTIGEGSTVTLIIKKNGGGINDNIFD